MGFIIWEHLSEMVDAFFMLIFREDRGRWEFYNLFLNQEISHRMLHLAVHTCLLQK